jgi:hypothetical protein
VTRAGEIARLIADLRDGDTIARESASARLRVIGARALTQLESLARADRSPSVRAAALATIEGNDHPHTADIAIAALADPHADVRAAAVPVLRVWMSREPGTRVLEALTGAALDRTQPAAVRLAALDALSDLPREIVQPILERAPDAGAPVLDDPQAARDWIDAHQDAPLSALHDVVVMARARERDVPTTRQQDWQVVRGAVHAVLARRRSRVALYDLRESVDAARSPLPLDFLTAIGAIGDGTCLESLARAWAAAPNEAWWRERLSEVGAAIAARERLTNRSASIKRIRTNWPEFLPSKPRR